MKRHSIWCCDMVFSTCMQARHCMLVNTLCSHCQNVPNIRRTCLIHHLFYYAHVNSCSTVFLPSAYLRLTEQPITHTLPSAHSRRDIPPTLPTATHQRADSSVREWRGLGEIGWWITVWKVNCVIDLNVVTWSHSQLEKV